MEYAEEVMTRYGYVIGNIDVTLILERPKVRGGGGEQGAKRRECVGVCGRM